jgi:cation transport regulator ChaC
MKAHDLDQVYYFAYGHNTYTPTMQKRCPGAQLMGVAVLHNFRFSFEKFANIESHDHAQTVGLLYKMPRGDLAHLDKDEAFHDHYTRILVQVYHEHTEYTAYVYIMEADFDPGDAPTAEYLRQVRKGYQLHGLPQDQIDQALARKHLPNS